MVFIAVSVSVALLGLTRIPSAYAHAEVTSPAIRTPGPDFLETCGQSSFDAVTNDATGHIEEQEPINQNAGCELTLCRGMLFSDQPASNVQTVKPNQAMEMSIDCTIPHGGPANVSLIDTTGGGAGEFIGSFLKTFDDFCPTSGETPADQTNLQFNLPSAGDIGSRCQNAGDCVVQLFWATPDFTQNYYYCVDVVMDAASAKDESEAAVPSFAESDNVERMRTSGPMTLSVNRMRESPPAMRTLPLMMRKSPPTTRQSPPMTKGPPMGSPTRPPSSTTQSRTAANPSHPGASKPPPSSRGIRCRQRGLSIRDVPAQGG
ncbi:hypothetical protein C8J57DRAFT_1351113 [Mycena rebaudengoi]|nr:hypothetical protein C8J57DRAFT_1351113 [Mycena rebaudengoi]